MKKILTFAVFLMLISCNQINNDCKDNKCSLDNNVENTKIVKQELMNVNKDMIKKDYSIYTAIWCPHCRAQYKHLQEIYDKYKENYHIVTVVAGTNTKQEVLEFMAENKYTFPIVYDDDLQLAKELEISSIPVIYENLEELDVEGLNVSDYYEKYKDEIDETTRKRLETVKIIDEFGKIHEVSEIAKGDAIVMYGAPWCPDCKAEITRLNSIKGKRKIVYIVDPKKFTYNEYKKFVSENTLDMKIYYATTRMQDIKWIPSVSEVKNSKFIMNFRPNNEYMVK